MELLFILWWDSCAQPSRTWLIFHVAAAEMYHPPPHCADIRCWVSMNVEQVLVNVTVCHFFSMEEEFSNMPLLHTHFHVRCCSVRQQQHLTLCWWEGSASTAIVPTSAADVVGQHNKMGSICSGAFMFAVKAVELFVEGVGFFGFDCF